MNNNYQQQRSESAYALALRPSLGVAGCGSSSQCGVPYGTPYGPYGLQYGLGDAAAAPAAPSTFGDMLAKLPSSWPYFGLGIGGTLALVGIILMATKK